MSPPIRFTCYGAVLHGTTRVGWIDSDDTRPRHSRWRLRLGLITAHYGTLREARAEAWLFLAAGAKP